MLIKFVRTALVATTVWCCFGTGCNGPEKTPFSTPQIDRVKLRAESDEPFNTTSSGLKFRIHREGDGTVPKRTDTVLVHYRGWLDDGTEFDSSYTSGIPGKFGVLEVVPGFSEGLQLVSKGGIIELEIPSELGYGAMGAGGKIPPDATLHFDIELLDIK